MASAGIPDIVLLSIHSQTPSRENKTNVRTVIKNSLVVEFSVQYLQSQSSRDVSLCISAQPNILLILLMIALFSIWSTATHLLRPGSAE